MKVIVAGSRTVKKYSVVAQAIDESPFSDAITEVVSGACQGVDREGERWAHANDRKIKRFPADWNLNGRAAGPIRNGEMAAYAHALIAVWDGKSRGTRDMINKALDRGLHVYVKIV